MSVRGEGLISTPVLPVKNKNDNKTKQELKRITEYKERGDNDVEVGSVSHTTGLVLQN